MFHRVADASKVALVALVERLREREFRLIDTQYTTPHLRSFGAVEIPRAKYMRLLKQALALVCRFNSVASGWSDLKLLCRLSPLNISVCAAGRPESFRTSTRKSPLETTARSLRRTVAARA